LSVETTQCPSDRRTDGRTYKLRLAGLVSEDRVGRALAVAGVSSHRLRTMLLVNVEEGGGLSELHRQLHGHGLRILETRRLPDAPEAPVPGVTTDRGPVSTTPGVDHELALAGEVGTALGEALQSYVTGSVEFHTVLCTSVPSGLSFVDLVLRLEADGLYIASIALMDQRAGPSLDAIQPGSMPRQTRRTAHPREAVAE
jgi:hypothetical protein